ncbi:Gfo/Idh/MocA family protein [Bacillus sp. PS06]|uniref:Gfo/Idh/MocA family protein n=1 Tax=Bacillus sp. PS06 TaxID=2764176 RepID=UPI0017831C1A|nr:Gfo/Idh/MocA family oxidoreductase [Bacillus sp. PS06]MBD8068524.1 Gfo/Idh/MocA family oxidoreductase [Bacillus sp. PS06]
MIRFGVIGTNWITESFINAATEIEDFKLTAVYSRTEDRASEFAAKFNVSTYYTNLEEMAQSQDIDAIYIASPNSFHSKQAVLFLQNGKHVLCEKPIASNSIELQQMIDAAKNNQVLLMEALKTTFLPGFRSIQEHLHKLGEIRHYFGSFCQYSSRYDAYKSGTVLNAFNPIFSNGAIMDIGVYTIYPMVVLFGKPDEVKANAIMLESGVDGQGSLLFKYPEMTGTVMYSKISNSYIPSEIQGENGTMIIDNIHTLEKINIQYRDGSVEDISVPIEHHSMYYEAKEFIELIKNKEVESNINSLQHSQFTTQVLDEARKQIGLVFPADQI